MGTICSKIRSLDTTLRFYKVRSTLELLRRNMNTYKQFIDLRDRFKGIQRFNIVLVKLATTAELRLNSKPIDDKTEISTRMDALKRL